MLLGSACIVRPVTAKALGVVYNDDLVGTAFFALLFGPLWLFLGLPLGLVVTDEFAAGFLLCSVGSTVDAWIMIGTSIFLQSSRLNDLDLYFPDADASAPAPTAPVDTILNSGAIYGLLGLTVLKSALTYFVYQHFRRSKNIATKADGTST
jgi:hypothetical protein